MRVPASWLASHTTRCLFFLLPYDSLKIIRYHCLVRAKTQLTCTTFSINLCLYNKEVSLQNKFHSLLQKMQSFITLTQNDTIPLDLMLQMNYLKMETARSESDL